MSSQAISPKEILCANLLSSIQAKQSFIDQAQAQIEVFDQAVRLVVDRYRHGGRLYIAGNGGSAADAQHLAAEFVSKLARDRAALPAEALTVDSSILTAIGNDYGFEHVFSRQLQGKLTEKDVFLGITTSGNSQNIVRALEVCREKSVPSIVFSGHDGGRVRAMADHCIIASGKSTATIQELHIVLAHTLCECVERSLFEH
jgi:D-sedoheptulose 7-phosphate isomerase